MSADIRAAALLRSNISRSYSLTATGKSSGCAAEQGAVEQRHVGALPHRRHQVRGIAEQRDAWRRRPGQADRAAR
ncbi:MAG: hypothetical protein ABSA93_36940 [Streptosporangiaceae bacterium]